MGTPIEHCYFTDGGMVSLVIRLEDGASIEAAVVGKEGFAGGAALMGFKGSSKARAGRNRELIYTRTRARPACTEWPVSALGLLDVPANVF
jgi:hypothetical protein